MKNVVLRAGLLCLAAVVHAGPSADFYTQVPGEPVKSAKMFGNGVNLQPSYYHGGYPDFAWSLMKQYPNIKTVRIEIEPDSVIQATSWISQARRNGYAVIATYHKYSALGSDDPNELITAANWWRSNYAALASAGSFTINLMNEWGSHRLSPDSYARAYNAAIEIIRGIPYSDPIIIDIPGFGQETAVAAAAVKGLQSVPIRDGNIILSVHAYPASYNSALNHPLQVSDLDELASTGRACVIGEFGAASTGGESDWSGIVDYAKQKGWAVLGWSWNGDGGSMNMVVPSWSQASRAETFSPGPYFNKIYEKLGP